jgi:hypothetical protein
MRCGNLERELILVYNADSGVFNLIKDALHKTISPSTYLCNLCSLTFGMIGMKDEWKSFIDKLNIPYTFLHRDEFFKKLKRHPHDLGEIKFPAIFLNKDGKIGLLINHNEINACQSLDDLMNLLSQKLGI